MARKTTPQHTYAVQFKYNNWIKTNWEQLFLVNYIMFNHFLLSFLKLNIVKTNKKSKSDSFFAIYFSASSGSELKKWMVFL
jgi:hypothetical protein